MIPLIGPAIQTITLSRFCGTMALALDAGLDPIRSIRLSLDSTDSDFYRSGANDAQEAILAGATLAGALQATQLFPADFIARVDISEHSGTDAIAMEQLSREYDDRARMAIKLLSTTATVIVRVVVIALVVFLIYRVSGSWLGAYNEALAPINVRK
jgi:type II secretory pathway component PulF